MKVNRSKKVAGYQKLEVQDQMCRRSSLVAETLTFKKNKTLKHDQTYRETKRVTKQMTGHDELNTTHLNRLRTIK